jgi:outer membrane receptor protein involved in Fe transport
MRTNTAGLRLLTVVARGGLALLSAAAAAPALAQSVRTGADRTALEEIVVTAQFRREPIQDVPLSITALDTATIEARGIDEFADYARSVPGLSFASRGANRSEIVIRGISPVTGESAVGLYLDGVGQSNSFNNPDYRLFDVERIEVLRGPQGTLYGEGSLGGTIKIITNRPDVEAFATNLEATGSDTSGGGFNSAVNGLVNLPLAGGRAGVRVTGLYREESGWIDNRADGSDDVNDVETYGGRVAFRLTPGEDLDLQAIVNYQRDEVGNLDVRTALPPEAFGLPPGTPPFGEHEVYAPLDNHEDQRNVQYTLLGERRFARGSLEGVIGYNDEKDQRAIDSITAGLPPGLPLLFDSHSKTAVAELRYLSALGGAWDFVAGAFYRDRSRDNELVLVDGGALFGLDGDFVNVARFETETAALFGETYYRVGRLTGTLGLRAFREEVRTPARSTIGELVLDESSPSETFDAVTGKVGLSFAATDDVLAYLNVAQGYRSGGNNPLPSADPNYVAAYDPDEAWSYELGLKSQWLDHRVTANAAVYYIDWQDLQILGVPTNPALGFTTNAGAAHSTGVELELSARATEHLSLDFSIAYTEAELDEPAQGAPAGTPLANVPDWSVNGALEYRRPAFAGFDGFARVDWSFKSSTHSSVPPAPESAVPSYDTGNLRFGLDGERYSAFVFVNNLTDDPGVTFAGTSGQYMSRPRTVGLTFRARY